MGEKDINLTDLLVEILLRWRIIVVIMLVAGCVAGGASYVQSKVNVQKYEQRQAVLEQQANENGGDFERTRLEAELTEQQIANVNAVKRNEEVYKKIYTDYKKYAEQSVLMKIDANNVPRTELIFYVSAEDTQTAYDIERCYEKLAVSADMWNYLTEYAENMSEAEIGELIFLEKSSSRLVLVNNIMNNNIVNNSLVNDSNIMRVVVIAEDQTICQTLAQGIIDYFADKNREMEAEFGEHKITLVNQAYALVSDKDLLLFQKDVLTQITNIGSALEKNKAALSAEELAYYRCLSAEYTDSSDISNRGKMTPEVQTEAVILGMIMAAFLSAFAIFVRYISNTKIRITDNLQVIYAIPKLGQVAETSQKKRVFGFVDQWILLLRNRNQRKFSREESIRLAAAAIRLAVEKSGEKEVYFLGCDLKGKSMDVCEELRNILGTDEIGVQILNNALYDAEVMEKLISARTVVLLETAGATLYSEMKREIELLKRQEIKLLGYVIVE